MSKHKHRLGLCIILAFSVFYATFGLSLPLLEQIFLAAILGASGGTIAFSGFMAVERSEERRVGNECVSTVRSRWSHFHSKKRRKLYFQSKYSTPNKTNK